MKAPELKERLEESEKLIQEMTVTWEDKLRKTEAIALVRNDDMHKLDMIFLSHKMSLLWLKNVVVLFLHVCSLIKGLSV